MSANKQTQKGIHTRHTRHTQSLCQQTNTNIHKKTTMHTAQTRHTHKHIGQQTSKQTNTHTHSHVNKYTKVRQAHTQAHTQMHTHAHPQHETKNGAQKSALRRQVCELTRGAFPNGGVTPSYVIHQQEKQPSRKKFSQLMGKEDREFGSVCHASPS